MAPTRDPTGRICPQIRLGLDSPAFQACCTENERSGESLEVNGGLGGFV